MIYEPFDIRLIECQEYFGGYLDYNHYSHVKWMLANAGISANFLIDVAQKAFRNDGIISETKTWDAAYKASMHILLKMARAGSLTMEQLFDYRRLLTSEKGIGNG